MQHINKNLKSFTLFFVITLGFLFFSPVKNVYAATSPVLSELNGYSVLGGQAVTNTGSTTTTGKVGVSPGTSITGFPPGSAGGGTQSNNASAISAQADALTAFGTLNQTCDQTFGAVDLTTTFPSGVGPGVYCSTSSFSLSGNLTLTGTSGVWIFKTVSTLITSPGSSVTGGDPCNVWWRIGSSTTLDTTTSFIGTVISQTGVNAMNTSATLNGRFIGLSAATVTLDTNTISGPTCSSTASTTTTSGSTATIYGPGSSTQPPGARSCPALNCVTPVILESRRTSADSIFLSWGPYAGINTFLVQYGPSNGNWLYSTTVTGFSTTLNALPTNQPIWVLVSPTDGCSTGLCGQAKLVGGPGLPNTGRAATATVWLFLLKLLHL